MATTAIEDVAAAVPAQSASPDLWFQLYILKDAGLTKELVDRAAAAGYRVLAPDQRGYSPGARPTGRRACSATNLRDDVLALADKAGAERFDVVGHDWGGFVAWDLAARHADRVRSCTSLSTPHPGAIRDVALKSTQLLHLWYLLGFQVPIIPELTLKAVGPSRGARMLERGGLDPETAAQYAARFADRDEMRGQIDWYRALPFDLRDPVRAMVIAGRPEKFAKSIASWRSIRTQ